MVLACSHGGHLELLEQLRPFLGRVSVAWVTAPSAQAEALRASGERVVLVPNPDRRALGVVANARLASRAFRSLRPRLVISSGANVAVPFCLLARARGVPLIFVETMARVERGSLSGRLLAPFAQHVLVQWPELRRSYPDAEVCRPALLEGVPREPAGEGRGTVVAAGSHGQPFDRLVDLAAQAAAAGLLPEPVTVQALTSRVRRAPFDVVASLPAEEMRRRIAEAAVVITHGGAAILSLALRSGRMPLVLPRRQAHGEHVDDHQVTMVGALDRRGFVVSLDERSLGEALELSRTRWPERGAEGLEGPPLGDRLGALVDEALR